MTSSPSLLGSFAAISSDFAYRCGSASPKMSTGLLWLQWGGKSSLNAFMVSSDNSVSFPPPVIKESVANTPGPPALVKIVKLRPLGRDCFPNTSAM